MSRPVFSPTDDSYVRDFQSRPVAGVSVKVFTARTGGTQITDLLAVDDAGNVGAAIPGGILVSDRDGLIPAFAGPDGGPVAVWVNTGQGGVRNLLRADATGGGGGGGSQFTSVLGKSSGSVTGADIVADSTVSTALSSKAAVDLSNVDPSAGRSALQLGSAATRSVGQIASDPTLSGTYAPINQVAAVASASGALVAGKHNPVDATGGARAMTLANATADGVRTVVEKTDASTNAVAVTLNLRGTASSTITLVWQNEALELLGKADGSWWPVAGHKTKTSLDGAYGPGGTAGNVGTSQVSAAVSGLAPLASPSLTGSPTAPTATTGDSSTKVATTAFVAAAVAAVGSGSSGYDGGTW